MNTLSLWQQAQKSIQEKIGAPSYETWFSSLNVKQEEDQLIIETPDDFFKNWIIDNYLSIIQDSLTALSAHRIPVSVTVNPSIEHTPNTHTQAPQTEPLPDKTPASSRFSFDNFVVGPSNRFAYAASMAVAESPAKSYNPLFIYGQVGLGKTHLMQAIAYQIQLHTPKLKTSYLSSEHFTNELIDAIRHRSTTQFRQKYRTIDVLLIDDIHFIAGKESTQEEFFHTFNTLHNNRKQIIISSDRPPKEIANLEERLSSRFTWGLITDIQPPDYETRVAILKKKIEQDPVQVPDDVICFIAEEIKTNIRELEGALIRVVAYSLLEDRPISLEMAKMILKDMVKQSIKIISVEMIQKQVCERFQVSLTDLKAKKRNRNIIIPRQIAMFLSRQLTKLSLPEIGHAFGGKDHTTVLHSCKKIEQEIHKDKNLKNTIEQLSTSLKQ